MNQYPAGLVPMVMPQQYMVVPGAAMQLPPGMPTHPHAHAAHAHAAGALQPATVLHHQQMAAQAAASHAAGAPVITSPVVTSVGAVQTLPVGAQGMVSMAGFPSHMAGIGAPVAAAMTPASVPGLHQAVTGAIPTPFAALAPLASAASPLASANLLQQQHLQQPAQHPSPQLSHLQQLQQTSVAQQSLAADYLRKKDEIRSSSRGQRWQTDPELNVEELNLDESVVALDHFNSDLNLVIDPDGNGAAVLNDPSGFCFTWAGARATYGVCRGKVFFELHITEHLPTDFGNDHQETNPHIVRVGWSIDSSSFQLGEEPWSFGYGGTGKFSTNNRFSDYAVRFEQGDVIGAMLDLDSRPATMSYMKNGTWYGVAAPLHGFPVGSKEMALFPHVLSKNCRFKVNFGQQEPWFPPPLGFRYIGQLQIVERVRGMPPPARKEDCEMIMIVGLPGSGKTTWGINMQKSHPEKRYNIIGTDTLIDKMRVMGLPRKRNYHGRWDVLIEKSTKCLNKLFTIAARRKRNYILDQTNVYASARRRKMKNFTGFYRIASVLQPDDPELERRSRKRTQEDGKVVPESAVLEMKANFSLPEERDNLFDRIDYVELTKDIVQQLVRSYNNEGKSKPRTDGGNRNSGDHRNQLYGSYSNQNQSFGRLSGQNDSDPFGKRDSWYPDRDEPASKRLKNDPGSALDLLKKQYEEDDRSQQAAPLGRPVWPDPMKVKDELSPANVTQWPTPTSTASLPLGYAPGLIPSHAAAFQPGLLGAPPLPPGVQLAFLQPGMPSSSPHELTAGLGLPSSSAKAVQDAAQGQTSLSAQAQVQAHAQAQLAHAQAAAAAAAAAAVQGQILVDPSKIAGGNPFALVNQATGQNLYGAAPTGLEAVVSQEQRQAWQQIADQQTLGSQQIARWQELEDPSKSLSKPWQDKPASTSWPLDWHNDAQQESMDFRKRNENRDSYGRSDLRDRDRDRDRDHDRDWERGRDRERERERDRDREKDRDRHRDRDSSYGSYSRDRDRSKGSDRCFGSISDRRDVGYSRDSSSRHQSSRSSSPPWNQNYAAPSSPDHQDYDNDSGQKADRQRRRKSKWDQPDEETSTSESPVKSETSSLFSIPSSKTPQSLFNQPPPGFPAPAPFTSPAFSTSSSQPCRPANVSVASSQSPSKPSFDMNLARLPPPLLSNIKSEGASGNTQDTSSSMPEIKLPASGSGDGLLGQGPGPRPLIPGLQGNLGSQFRPRMGSGSTSDCRPPVPDGGLRRLTDTPNNEIKPTFGSDKSSDDRNKRPAPKPLIPLDDMKTEESELGSGDKASDNPTQSRGGPGKPGLFPTPGTPVADGPPRGPPFRPPGPAGVLGRFPGPPGGPPMPMPGGPPGMCPPPGPPGAFGRFPGPPGGPGGPPPGLGMPGPGGPHPPRGGPMGPRGPPPPRMGGPMGGPPRGPMGGPPRGPMGPGHWNGNRPPPRFGPRGPHGPPRPLFDGPPGRWPRMPR